MLLLLTDLAASLSLLSRLPVRVDHGAAGQRSAKASWAWPLAGAVLAALAAIPALALTFLQVPTALAAGTTLLALVMLTGAMHEDGLADSADGLWGGWEPARRLEIMKDSRVGVYGVLALIISLGLRWAALTALLSTGAATFVAGLIAAAAISRAAMTVVMHALPPARPDGLAAGVGMIPASAARNAALLAFLLSLGAGLGAGIAAVVAASLVALAVSRVAREKIGGQTGDILGATQQLSETAALIALSALLA